ncbi:hypothetical protein HY570_04520 [Candidatus Micrarchaeota archaeon]|nr:hypothetical protein [Candidatus Micrarchaeota archaeon]
MNKEKLITSLNTILQDKGKRKFSQSVELILNFRGIDFSKPNSRLNLEVLLPKGKGKAVRIGVFADGQAALDARNNGADVIFSTEDVAKLAADRPRLKKLLLDHEFLAQPSLMMVVGKQMGQVLGTKDRLPRPIVGMAMKDLMERAKRTIKLKSKGKYLPVAQCLVGTEKMEVNDLADNVEAVVDAVKNKVGEQSIKSAYVKLTMGKPVKIL